MAWCVGYTKSVCTSQPVAWEHSKPSSHCSSCSGTLAISPLDSESFLPPLTKCPMFGAFLTCPDFCSVVAWVWSSWRERPFLSSPALHAITHSGLIVHLLTPCQAWSSVGWITGNMIDTSLPHWCPQSCEGDRKRNKHVQYQVVRETGVGAYGDRPAFSARMSFGGPLPKHPHQRSAQAREQKDSELK